MDLDIVEERSDSTDGTLETLVSLRTSIMKFERVFYDIFLDSLRTVLKLSLLALLAGFLSRFISGLDFGELFPILAIVFIGVIVSNSVTWGFCAHVVCSSLTGFLWNNYQQLFDNLSPSFLKDLCNVDNYRFAFATKNCLHSVLPLEELILDCITVDGNPSFDLEDCFQSVEGDLYSFIPGESYKFQTRVCPRLEALSITQVNSAFKLNYTQLYVEHSLLDMYGAPVNVVLLEDISEYRFSQVGDVFFKGLCINSLFIPREVYRRNIVKTECNNA